MKCAAKWRSRVPSKIETRHRSRVAFAETVGHRTMNFSVVKWSFRSEEPQIINACAYEFRSCEMLPRNEYRFAERWNTSSGLWTLVINFPVLLDIARKWKRRRNQMWWTFYFVPLFCVLTKGIFYSRSIKDNNNNIKNDRREGRGWCGSLGCSATTRMSLELEYEYEYE